MFTFPEWNSQFEIEWKGTCGEYPNREYRKKLYKQYKLECEKDMNITVEDFVKTVPTSTLYMTGDGMGYPFNSNINHSHTNSHSFAATTCAQPTPKSWFDKPAKKEKEENLMSLNYATKIAPVAYASVSAAPSDAQTKIDYLRTRARDVKEVLSSALAKQFRLYDDGGVKSYQDLIDAIKADEFTLDAKLVTKDKEYFDEYGMHRYSPMSFFKFTKFPGTDRDGYNAGSAALKAEYQKIKDIINIKDADAALEAIQAFEGWTYTAPTVH